MKLIIGLFKLVWWLIKTVCLFVGTVILVVCIFWFFLDDLPLGPVPAELTAPSGGPYLDMHVHVAGLGEGNSGCFISEEMRSNFRYYFYLWALGVTEAEIKEQGDELVVRRLSELLEQSTLVDKAVLLALDGVVDGAGRLDTHNTIVYVPNEFVLDQVKKHDNLLYGASINPYRSDALERLAAAKRDGAVLIKWIPSIMEIDPADQKLTPFYQALVEHDLPLLIHTGAERSFSHANDELSDPKRIELPLKLGVKVIAAHIATTGKNDGQDNFERILPLFTKYPNLYTDISSLTQINKLGYLVKALDRKELEGRMMYGSDWPLQFFPLISPWYHFLHLSGAEMRYIFKQKNPFDRDVLLKTALGTPREVFAASRKLILGGEGPAPAAPAPAAAAPQAKPGRPATASLKAP